jgi:hypothetical protein
VNYRSLTGFRVVGQTAPAIEPGRKPVRWIALRVLACPVWLVTAVMIVSKARTLTFVVDPMSWALMAISLGLRRSWAVHIPVARV